MCEAIGTYIEDSEAIVAIEREELRVCLYWSCYSTLAESLFIAILTNSCSTRAFLKRPDPRFNLAKVVPQPLESTRRPSPPSITDTGEDLKALHLIALLGKVSHIAIEEILFSVQILEEFFTSIPITERL